MDFTSVFINAVVVALMTMYVYQNEKRMEEIAAKLNQTGTITTAILNRHSDMLEELLKDVQRDQNIPQLREMREIAYGKQARQSSDHDNDNDKASASVDGNLNTYGHTNFDESPYLEVDLGNEFQIKGIDIFNIKHCCGALLHDLDITIGPSQNQMYLCAHYKGPSQNGEHLVFECNHNTKYARYVRLTIKGREYLHVAELKVYTLED